MFFICYFVCLVLLRTAHQEAVPIFVDCSEISSRSKRYY